MKYLSVLLLIISITSCKQSVKKLSDKIINSDSMAINWFKGDGSIDTVVAVKIIKDNNAVNKLAEMAGGIVTQNFKCGYDGTLHFFKMNKVIQDIEFRMNDSNCSSFTFLLEGKLYSTVLTADAKALLQSLR